MNKSDNLCRWFYTAAVLQKENFKSIPSDYLPEKYQTPTFNVNASAKKEE
jgi:hypothetical protein